MGAVFREQVLEQASLGVWGTGWVLAQWDLYAPEAGLAGRAVGTSLLRIELFEEQRKAAGNLWGILPALASQHHGSWCSFTLSRP